MDYNKNIKPIPLVKFKINLKDHINKITMPYLIEHYGNDMALDIYNQILNKDYDKEPLNSFIYKYTNRDLQL